MAVDTSTGLLPDDETFMTVTLRFSSAPCRKAPSPVGSARMHTLSLSLGSLRIPLWIPVTLFAALMQALRTGLQARLKGTLRAEVVSFARFLYALPLESLAFLLLLAHFGGGLFDRSPWEFWLFCLTGGVTQIFGTLFLVRSFHRRGLVAGTAYAKTEAAQLVLLTTVFLGASLAPLAIVGIFLALVGVLILGGKGWQFLEREFWLGLREPAAGYGLAAALGFAVTAITLRAASQELGPGLSPLVVGLWVLLVTNFMQSILQGFYLFLQQPQQLWESFLGWRQAWPVGVLSALGSWAWFSGFALTQVALVRGLGQVDTLLVFLLGHHLLKERLGKTEITATLLIVLGALCIILPDLHWQA